MENSTQNLSKDENPNSGEDVLKDKVLSAFYNYIDAYFNQRNLERTLSLFSNELSGFGTGEDEVAFNRAGFAELYSRDLQQAPEKVECNFSHLSVQILTKTVGVVSAVFSITTGIAGNKIQYEGLRLSSVFREERGKWLMAHMHISIPTRTQEEGESYPLKELERRNKWLEQTVREKTAELLAINETLKDDLAKRMIIEQTLKDSEALLKETIAAKDRFFSIIAHDLRSPFTGLIGASHILADDYVSLSDTEKLTYINAIASRVDGIYKLVQNLLDWSRMHTGRMVFTPERFPLQPELQSTIDLLEEMAENKGVYFTTDIPIGLPVYADKNMLFSVIRNLVTNAIKFTHPGGAVTLVAQINNNKIEFEVADTGVGMSPETVKHLFDIKTAISTAGTHNEKGTGLGLLLCKELIEQNGGIISVHSTSSKGSKFTFSLPQEATAGNEN